MKDLIAILALLVIVAVVLGLVFLLVKDASSNPYGFLLFLSPLLLLLVTSRKESNSRGNG